MRKEDSFILVQLLEALQSIVLKLEKADQDKDMEGSIRLKREAKDIVSKIDSIV